ncbi:MAG TPA: histidine kinase [Lapillicoccus sp.]|nr:histidine kinase [Lapillicoccus sp.]
MDGIPTMLTPRTRRLLAAVGIPVALAIVGMVEMFTLPLANPWPGILVEWLACAALVVRRRHPVVTALVVLAALFLQDLVGVPRNGPSAPVIYFLLACYSLGRWTSWRLGVPMVLGIVVAILVIPVSDGGRSVEFGDVTFVIALAGPAYGFGLLVRRLAERNQELERVTEELRHERELVRRQAAAAERARLTRELHDVIAHSVTAMVVQASAADAVLESDPSRARASLREVTETGRQALAETGAVLRLVRDEDDEPGLDADTRLTDVDALVDRFRRQGLAVDYHLDGSLDRLPAPQDLSGYRIVRELLANALRHARGPAVALRISRDADHLLIETTNEANGVGRGDGLGLLGMRERAQLLGGALDVDQETDGRTTVRVDLPLTPVA